MASSSTLFPPSDTDKLLDVIALDKSEVQSITPAKGVAPPNRFARLYAIPNRTDDQVDHTWDILGNLKLVPDVKHGDKLSPYEIFVGVICYHSPLKRIAALAHFDDAKDSDSDITLKRLYTRQILEKILREVNSPQELAAVSKELKALFDNRKIVYFSHSRGWLAGVDDLSKNWIAVQGVLVARQRYFEKKEKALADLKQAPQNANGTEGQAEADMVPNKQVPACSFGYQKLG